MHYFTATYEPSGGMTPGAVFSLAAQHLHVAHANRFGLAFPESKPGQEREFDEPLPASLGRTMQVFVSEDALAEAVRKILVPMVDYLHVSPVRPVRGTSKHLLVRRIREADPGAARRQLERTKRKALAAGRPLDEKQLEARIAQAASSAWRGKSLPYLNIKSLSENRSFRIHFESHEVEDPKNGSFDSYGFSIAGTTVPRL
jgi:CRISPR-associated endoribonuclease Cas6/Csy4 subtype I-F